MRSSTVVTLGLALTLVCAGAHADSNTASTSRDSVRKAASRDGWPDTRAGEMGRRWAEAFSTGEAAMKAFTDSSMAPATLAKRTPQERVERYRDLRERFGTLALGSVRESEADHVSVVLMASDGSPHEFTFTIQPAAPYKLVTVSMKEMQQGIHGMFGGFHH